MVKCMTLSVEQTRLIKFALNKAFLGRGGAAGRGGGGGAAATDGAAGGAVDVVVR